MTAIRLYDLAAAEPERRFSPYCWRTKLALAHKGLAVETIPWRFTEKDAIASSGQGKVPVLLDGDRVVPDSWEIALYLEQAYPERPSLFGGDSALGACRFINGWADGVVIPGIVRLVVLDIWMHLDQRDRAYFRASREQRFGASLEEVAADRDTRVAALRQSLEPMRAMLRAQPYFGGAGATYADYSVFGCFQWPRCISRFRLIEQDDPVHAWRERMLDSFAGLARKAPAYDS